MSVINVNLYGDGSRGNRLRAEYIYCDHSHECSAYQEGKCFCVTFPFGIRCGVGEVGNVDGGTKQSKMYARVSKEARSHEAYHKLTYPHNEYVIKIGSKAFLSIPYTWIEELPDGRLKVSDPHLMTNRLLIDAERLTPENIKAICDAKPRAIMGGVISDYQAKAVPLFLHQFARVFPEKYKDMMLIAAHQVFGIGPDRAKRLSDAFDAAWKEFAALCVNDAKDDKEIWYTKEKIDRILRDICGEHFVPWDERYT